MATTLYTWPGRMVFDASTKYVLREKSVLSKKNDERRERKVSKERDRLQSEDKKIEKFMKDSFVSFSLLTSLSVFSRERHLILCPTKRNREVKGSFFPFFESCVLNIFIRQNINKPSSIEKEIKDVVVGRLNYVYNLLSLQSFKSFAKHSSQKICIITFSWRG